MGFSIKSNMSKIDFLIKRIELHLSLSANDEALLRKELLKYNTDKLADWDLAMLADYIMDNNKDELTIP